MTREIPKKDNPEQDNFLGPFNFEGFLKSEDSMIAVSFVAVVNNRGQLIINFPEMPATREIMLISHSDMGSGRLRRISIEGKTEDGKELSSDSLFFSEVNSYSDQEKSTITLGGKCSNATLRVPGKKDTPVHGVRFWLRGMRGFRAQSQQVGEGTVVLKCPTKLPHPDHLTGLLQYTSHDLPINIEEAEENIANLLEKILVVISLSSGIYAKPRVEQYFRNDENFYIIRDHVTVESEGLGFFSELYLGSIFSCAVNNAFIAPNT